MRQAVLAGLAVAAVVFAVVLAAGGDGGSSRTPRPKPEPERTAAAPTRAAAAPDGREVFARMGCGSCHQLAAAGSAGRIGPSLDKRLPDHTRASLRSKILNPSGSSAYSGMPGDFGERMRPAELDALVRFLLRTAR